MVQLQAHRGVCTEYPENTMSAFYGAVYQGYEIIELDPNVTADGAFIILHDGRLKRTARRPDGSVPDENLRITEITYEEADSYEYGSWFSPKFKGERIPLLKDVLELAKEHDVKLKIDNKIWKFSEEHMQNFWSLLRESGVDLGITCDTLERVQRTLKELPGCEIHYDGIVTEEILQELCKETDRLTVWLPFQSKETSWVKIPFADEALCSLVKKYAKLGLWLVVRYEDFDEICERYQPDVVETPGQIKPVRHQNRRVDMHTHSEHSHDSKCPIIDMAKQEEKQGAYGFAVTDHCGMRACERKDVTANIRASAAEAETLRNEIEAGEQDIKIHVLSGIEIGEATWYPKQTEQVLKACDYDVVISSVHTVNYEKYGKSYSKIDFSMMEAEEIHSLLEQYFEDLLQMVQTVPCDAAAHLLCPLKYINGKYGRAIDCRRYEEKIRTILQAMIKRGIALEVNTSCMEGTDVDWLEQDWLLGIYKELGGLLVTIGSDAHVCENASKQFDRAMGLLKKYGFRNCFYYEKRKCIQCAI